MGYIGVDPSDAARDIATEQMSATAGAAQSGQGAANVLDGRADTLWHTTWGGGHGRENHWIQFELKDFYMVDGIHITGTYTQSIRIFHCSRFITDNLWSF